PNARPRAPHHVHVGYVSEKTGMGRIRVIAGCMELLYRQRTNADYLRLNSIITHSDVSVNSGLLATPQPAPSEGRRQPSFAPTNRSSSSLNNTLKVVRLP